jgi:hypothetical protein
MNRHHGVRLLGLVVLFFAITLACAAAEKIGNAVPTQGAKNGIKVGSLDEETLANLALSTGGSGQAKPGDRLELKVGLNQCCYYFEPVLASVEWSIDPPEAGRIDPSSGALVVDKDAQNGSQFRVNANVENGRKQLSGLITVFRPEESPLVGTWHEKAPQGCEGQELTAGEDILRELVFKADGSFQATFTPFEIYHDYWGSYAFDPNQSSLSFQVSGGNFIPEKLDLKGSYSIEQDSSLILEGIWLGRRETDTPTGCGHVFAH